MDARNLVAENNRLVAENNKLRHELAEAKAAAQAALAGVEIKAEEVNREVIDLRCNFDGAVHDDARGVVKGEREGRVKAEEEDWASPPSNGFGYVAAAARPDEVKSDMDVVVSPTVESRRVCEPKTNVEVIDNNTLIATESGNIVLPITLPTVKNGTNVKIDISENGVASSMITSNIVSPVPRLSLTHYLNDTVKEEQSDEESRFFQADESDESEGEVEEKPEGKCRKLDSSSEDVLNAAFWSVNQEDTQFTEESFMTKSLFHLNSFVNSGLKRNSAFNLFLREGIATPGFYPVPNEFVNRISIWTYSQLKEELKPSIPGHCKDGARQTALWLKDATVGSFILMRHEYPNCGFCPRRLKDESGEYIGPVYVLGIITKKVVPWSEEEREIADNRAAEFSKHHWEINNICRVRWEKMGYKKSLKKSTIDYINKICQPTLQRISNDVTNVSHQDCRRDLWTNATIPIRPDDFPEKFKHCHRA